MNATDGERRMERLSQPSIIELIYGAPEFGYRLITRSAGEAEIESHSWNTWADVASSAGVDWEEFSSLYEDVVEEFGESAGLDSLLADTVIDPAQRSEILGRIGEPADVAACRELVNAVGEDSRAMARLSEIACIGWDSPGGSYEAVVFDNDEAVAAFQRVLDEEGLSHIRLVRDDEFVRKVFA